MTASGGAPIDLTVDLDRRVQYGGAVPLQWTEDSGAILFPAADHGMRHVYAITPTLGSVAKQLTTGPRQITHFSAAGSTLLCAMKDEHAPAELIRFSMPSTNSSDSSTAAELGALTAINAHVLADVETAAAEQFNYTSWDGQTLEGWIMRPAGWVEGKSYPAILNVHGGPHGMQAWPAVDTVHLQSPHPLPDSQLRRRATLSMLAYPEIVSKQLRSVCR